MRPAKNLRNTLGCKLHGFGRGVFATRDPHDLFKGLTGERRRTPRQNVEGAPPDLAQRRMCRKERRTGRRNFSPQGHREGIAGTRKTEA